MRLALILAPSLLLACDQSSATREPLPSASYSQLVEGFDTLEACQAAAIDGFNCLRTLTLCADGSFTLIVTDIVNGGHYEVEGHTVHATLDGPGDAPDTFTLELTSSGFTSPELDGEHPWLGGASAEAVSACGG